MPVRVTLVLPQGAGDDWTLVESDVLEGNNVKAAAVSFGAALALIVEPDVPVVPDPNA